MAFVLTTVWILFNGWMIISGRSRESMMGLVVQALRVVLIVTAATTMAFGSTRLYTTPTDGSTKNGP